MKDVLTDLNAEGEVLPLSPPRDDWLGHKGMVQAAEYIRKKLLDEGIITRALAKVLYMLSLPQMQILFYLRVIDILNGIITYNYTYYRARYYLISRTTLK